MWRIAGGKLLYLPGRSAQGSVGELEGWEGLRVGRKVPEGGEIYTHTHTHWRREWQPTPVFFPGESHGQRSLAGYNP